MTSEQIEASIIAAKRPDGSYEAEAIAEMNSQGIWFAFMNTGVRWSRKPFA